MKIEIVGIYSIEADEPCHLVECWLIDVDRSFDLASITQQDPSLPPDNWQVPYDEYVLSDDGTSGDPMESAELSSGDVRIAFFFHYLDLGRPLDSPAGSVKLPEVSKRPSRLEFIEYYAP